MTRPGSRRDYRHFPEAYADLLLRFDQAGAATLGPMAERDARLAVRDLYRWKMFLSAGCDADPGDAHCRRLLTIFTRLTLRVEPCAVTDPRGDYFVNLTTNPIVAAMENRP